MSHFVPKNRNRIEWIQSGLVVAVQQIWVWFSTFPLWRKLWSRRNQLLRAIWRMFTCRIWAVGLDRTIRQVPLFRWVPNLTSSLRGTYCSSLRVTYCLTPRGHTGLGEWHNSLFCFVPWPFFWDSSWFRRQIRRNSSGCAASGWCAGWVRIRPSLPIRRASGGEGQGSTTLLHIWTACPSPCAFRRSEWELKRAWERRETIRGVHVLLRILFATLFMSLGLPINVRCGKTECNSLPGLFHLWVGFF